MVDFKALVGSGSSRPTLRPIANLNQSKGLGGFTWTNYNPSSANKNVNRALNNIANAPVSTGFWDNFVTDFKDFVQKPAVQGTLNVLDMGRNGLATQIDRWTDGSFDEYDVPGVGFADGMWGSVMGKKVYADDLMNKAGWQNKEGWNWGDLGDMAHDTVGFIGDVALDPITYMTFGAGSAAKATASSVARSAADEALQVGLRAGLQKGTPQLENFVQDALTKAGKAQANNQLLGFNIPFGPEISLMRKGDLGTDFLKVKSQNIGKTPAIDLAKRMENVGLAPDERYKFMSDLFGRQITSTKQLNTQEFDHLWKLLDNGLDRGIGKVKDAEVNSILNGTDILNDINAAHGVPQPSLESLAKKAGQSYKYYEGADGISDLGKLLKGNRVAEGIGNLLGGKRYVAPSVNAADHRIGKAVDVIEDARIGGFAKARGKVDEMEQVAQSAELKALSPEEMELLPYVIEGKWPQGLDPANIEPATMGRLKAAADKLTEYRDKFTKEELDAGVQYTARDNYFPHILDIPKDREQFDALIATLREADPDLALKLENAPRGFTRERKLFDSMADIKDFLTKNADNEGIQKQFGNAVFNPVEAYAKRAMSGAQAVAKQQSYRQLEQLGVARKLKPDEHLPAGWSKIDIPGMENSIVPNEVKKRMENLTKIMTNDVSINKVANKADQIYTMWRRNSTVINPGFHVRQIIGNIFQNTLAGVGPKAYAEATKVLLGKGTVKIGGQELTPDRIIKMAMEDGILGTGSSTDFLNSLTKELGARTDKGSFAQRWLNPMSEKFTPGQMGRKASEAEDNWSRLANYIHVLQKGGTRKIAKESVMKHLFDYSNLSNFERGVMRAAFPFYAWMRNNIPFQIAQAIKRPGLYQIIDDMQEGLLQEPDVQSVLDQMGINRDDHRQIAEGLAEDNGGVLPDYIQERYMNVGGDNYFNMSLPSSDLSILGKNPWETALQSGNPLVGWAYGMGTNTNTFGAPINRYGDSIDVPSGVRYTLDQLGGFPGRAAGMMLGNIMPDVVGQTSANDQPLLAQIGRLLGITQVDPTKSMEGLIYERSRQVDNQKKRQKAMEGR